MSFIMKTNEITSICALENDKRILKSENKNETEKNTMGLFTPTSYEQNYNYVYLV